MNFCDLKKFSEMGMDFNKFMAAISLREDTLDDLTYLQKHLRLFIKFHQVSGKPTKVAGWSDDESCSYHENRLLWALSTYFLLTSWWATRKYLKVSCGVTIHDIDLLLLGLLIAETILEALHDSWRWKRWTVVADQVKKRKLLLNFDEIFSSSCWGVGASDDDFILFCFFFLATAVRLYS